MISQTVEYALRAMSYLASAPGEAANARSIAGATLVPQGYLSKIMRAMVCADLVTSFRGPHGGFKLARAPGAISVLDIVNAVDPIQRIARCPLNNPLHSNLCALHRCLDDALEQIEQTFRRTTLGTVLRLDEPTGGCHSLFPRSRDHRERNLHPERH